MNLFLNTAWYFSGNASAATSQFLIIFFLGRFGNASLLGQYSLSLAICSPAFLFSEFRLREVIASDVSGRFSDQEYFTMRFLTATFLSIFFVAGGIFFADNKELGKIIAAVAIWKGFDSVADIGYGWFQQRKQMRAIGVSMTLRNAAVLGSVIIGFILFNNLTSAILLSAISSGLILLVHDFRSIRLNIGTQANCRNEPWAKLSRIARLTELSRTVLPLGAVSGLTSFRVAVPRYFIGSLLNESALGYFTAAYALPAIGTVLVTSFGQSFLPQVAESYRQKGDRFWHDTMRALWLVSGIGFVGVVLAVFFGDELLQHIYGAEFKNFHIELIGLSVAVGLTFGCSILGISLTASGNFRIQVPIYISVVIVAMFCCALLVPLYGLLGAVYAMILSALLWLVLSFIVLRQVSLNK